MNISTIDGRSITMLMGMPRSGTTWLAKILDSHPWTLYRHEPDVNRPVPPESEGDAVLLSYLAELVGNRYTRAVGKAPWFPKSFDSAMRKAVRPTILRGMKAASRLGGDRTVPDMIPARHAAQVHPVLKSVNISDLLGRLARAVPSFHGVAIMRHPCGYASSVIRGAKKAAFTGAKPVTENLKPFETLLDTSIAKQRELTMDKVKALTPAERLAWLWLASNDRFLESAQPCDNVTVVSYEELCADPLTISRELFSFLGLEWSEQTQRFIEASTSHDDSAFYSVYKNPAKSANRWQEELSKTEIDEILGVVHGTPIGDRYAPAP